MNKDGLDLLSVHKTNNKIDAKLNSNGIKEEGTLLSNDGLDLLSVHKTKDVSSNPDAIEPITVLEHSVEGEAKNSEYILETPVGLDWRQAIKHRYAH